MDKHPTLSKAELDDVYSQYKKLYRGSGFEFLSLDEMTTLIHSCTTVGGAVKKLQSMFRMPKSTSE